MTTFNLRGIVKAVCDTSSATNDDELAKEVLAQIDRLDEHAALEQALLAFVRGFVSRDHRPLSAPQTAATSHSPVDAQGGGAGGGVVPFRSRKVSAIRSMSQQWQDQLKARVNIGHKERKFWGDCTLDDLAFIAKHRRDLAEANLATAGYVDNIAQLMREFAVDTVRELPTSAIERLGGAA